MRKCHYLVSLLLISILFVSCKSIWYQKNSEEKLPTLSAIGSFERSLLEKRNFPKTIPALSQPILLKVEKIKITKSFISQQLNKNNSAQDSLLISLEILDKINLAQQLNSHENLIQFIKFNKNFRIVTEIEVSFNKNTIKKISSADQVYLITGAHKEIYLNLHSGNQIVDTVLLSEGEILTYKASSFCWGLDKRREIKIFDIVPFNKSCNKGLYKSAQKAKEKNEFKF